MSIFMVAHGEIRNFDGLNFRRIQVGQCSFDTNSRVLTPVAGCKTAQPEFIRDG